MGDKLKTPCIYSLANLCRMLICHMILSCNRSRLIKKTCSEFKVRDLTAWYNLIRGVAEKVAYLWGSMIQHLLPGWIQRLDCSEALFSHMDHLSSSRVHRHRSLKAESGFLGLLLGLRRVKPIILYWRGNRILSGEGCEHSLWNTGLFSTILNRECVPSYLLCFPACLIVRPGLLDAGPQFWTFCFEFKHRFIHDPPVAGPKLLTTNTDAYH